MLGIMNDHFSLSLSSIAASLAPLTMSSLMMYLENMLSMMTCFKRVYLSLRNHSYFSIKCSYQKVVEARKNPDIDLDKETADVVAQAMMKWAEGLGVTHFCHWFQPLSGVTAQKQDACRMILT